MTGKIRYKVGPYTVDVYRYKTIESIGNSFVKFTKEFHIDFIVLYL